MSLRTLLALACLASSAAALNLDVRSVLYERDGAPKDWAMVSRTHPEQVSTFTLALRQRNTDQLISSLYAVSDPKSPEYGNYLTRDEVLSIVAPAPEHRSAVEEWLMSSAESQEIVSIKDYVDALKITAKVSFIERLFNTQMYSFVHLPTKSVVIRQMGEYSIPTELREAIHLITGIDEFPPIRKANKRTPLIPEGKTNGCNIPYTMKILYNMPNNLTVTNPQAVQAPYSQVTGEEGFGAKSLVKWLEYNNYPVNLSPVDCLLGDETSKYFNASDDGEGTLDIQMLTTFGLGAKTCFWLMQGWMYDFANELFNTTGAPLVNSISYGWNEWQQCDTSILQENCKKLGIPNSQVYVERTEIEWGKIGNLGITLLAASGDQGAPGDANIGCTSKAHPINPLYPGASAYITSVGATNLRPSNVTIALPDAPPICKLSGCNCSVDTEEVPAMLDRNQCIFTTGGGFSEYIPRPSYQDTQVAAWLASTARRPASNLFNATNRAFPDISALGWFIETVYDGQLQLSGGTSASTPIIGGMITQLNNWRLNNNKPPIGFFNPLLYQIYEDVPDAFHDVTLGGNSCTEEACCEGLGYAASPGWDPVSGVGTPNFGKILAYIQSLEYPHALKNLP